MSDIFSIIRENGRSENVKDGSDYWSIMDAIYTEYISAGGNWNRPKMLVRNGEIVVHDGLANLAWDYGNDLQKGRNAALLASRSRHKPEWLE